jgi:prepilin-type N-terminal cleavage/methylation domain-containing protein
VTGRRGFTLLEVLLAIVLTGVVALLVYGAAGMALETQQRTGAAREELQWSRGWHATLPDALRNARPARIPQDTAFWIEHRIGTDGIPRDHFMFVTAGGTPPLTSDADWIVSVDAGETGIVMSAAPVGVVGPPVVASAPAGLVGLAVRVLGFTRESEWTDRWRFPAYVPRGVELVYWGRTGPVDTVRLALPLGGAP